MGRTVDKIDKEIAAINELSSQLAQEIYQVYGDYIPVLGKVARHHLIQAAYYICTQVNPDQFIKLSVSKRQELQQNLRLVGDKIVEQLASYLFPKQLKSSSDTDSSSAPVINLELNPDELDQWPKNLDQAIIITIKSLSNQANRFLEELNIISKCPDGLLEAIPSLESAPELKILTTPHVLQFRVETNQSKNNDESEDQESQEKEPLVLKITAINLRLTDLEFNDMTLTQYRNQIKKLQHKITNLKIEYHKKQTERLTAEAESAWRSTWFND